MTNNAGGLIMIIIGLWFAFSGIYVFARVINVWDRMYTHPGNNKSVGDFIFRYFEQIGKSIGLIYKERLGRAAICSFACMILFDFLGSLIKSFL